MKSHVRPVPENKVLQGLEVVELSLTAAGAYSGRLLAQLGANVQRVGNALDLFAPTGPISQAAYSWFDTNKNILTPNDHQALAAALERCHLVIAERDPRRPEHQSLVAHAVELASRGQHPPHVVYVDTAVGGPDGEQGIPSSPICTSAWSATSWSLGDADDEPLSLPFDLTAYNAALHGAAAGLASLLTTPERSVLPQAQVVARDVMSFQTGMITANFIPYERPWRREGRRPPGSAGLYPVGLFECADGHVILLCRSQAEWDTLIELMGRPSWSRDPRFADPRVVAREHADEVDQYLIPWIASKTQKELSKLGAAAGLPVAPVKTISQALQEPQFEYRHFLTEVPAPTPTNGPEVLREPTVPWKLSELDDSDNEATSRTCARGWPVAQTRASEPASVLRGLRVLDLSWVWSGPMTASILGNLGADVIKVEHSGHLDTGRARGRARRNGAEIPGPEHEVTPYFNQMNYGKRSITIDMKTDAGRELILELAQQCDVVIENMRPGALERNGLSYAALSAQNPSIVMVSLSMAGQEGPLRALKGYAAIMAALSGLESLVGYDSDRLVGTLSPSIGDPNAAGHALVALFAALLRRKQTGRGAWIDLSQVEALLSVLPVPVIEAQLDGAGQVPANRHPTHEPHGHYPCLGIDQWLAIDVSTQAEWVRLCALGSDDGFTEFADLSSLDLTERQDQRAHIADLIRRWSSKSERDSLVARLLEANIAAAPLLSYEELQHSDWLKSRQLTVPVDHPYLGTIDQYVVPWRFDGVAQTTTAPAPLLGAHTDSVLREVLGKSTAEIKILRDSGALK